MATSLLKKKFSKALIADMAERLTCHRFNPQLKQIDEDMRKATDALYEEHYAKDLKAMYALPKGWLKEKMTFFVYGLNRKGERKTLLTYKKFYEPSSYERARLDKQGSEITVDYIKVSLSEQRRFPYADSDNLFIRADNAHLQKILELMTKRTDTMIEREDFQEEMETLLRQAENFQTLYERWPEVRELLREFEPTPPAPKKPLPPATIFEDLNSKLGIPTEKAIIAMPA